MSHYVGHLAATRGTAGISLAANLLFLTTVSNWLLYELMIIDGLIILANICAVIAVTVIIAAKMKYK